MMLEKLFVKFIKKLIKITKSIRKDLFVVAFLSTVASILEMITESK